MSRLWIATVASVGMLFTASAALMSCGFGDTEENTTFTLSLYVPGFPDGAAPGAPLAKAIGPYTNYVTVATETESGSVSGPTVYPVTPGAVNEIAITIPRVRRCRVVVNAYETGDVLVATADQWIDLGVATRVSISMRVSSYFDIGAFAFIPGAFTDALSTEAGRTLFFQATCGQAGAYVAHFSGFERHWLAAFDAETGEPLDALGSEQANGWVLFEASAGQSVTFAIAPRPNEEIVSTPVIFAKANFVVTGGSGGSGTRADPFRKMPTAADLSAAPNEAWVVSGSETLTASLAWTSDAAVIGGFSPDFSEHDPERFPSVLSGQSSIASISGTSFQDFLLEGFKLVAAEVDAPAEAIMAYPQNTGGGQLARIRACEVDIGMAYPIREISGITASFGAASSRVVIESCTVSGGRMNTGAWGATLSGIKALGMGILHVVDCYVSPGESIGTYGSASRSAGIYLGSSGCNVTVRESAISGGTTGSAALPSAYAESAAIYGTGLGGGMPTVAVLRSALYGGTVYASGANATYLYGLYDGSIVSSTRNVYVVGSLVSAGKLFLPSNASVLHQMSGIRSGQGMLRAVGSTIDGGAMTWPGAGAPTSTPTTTCVESMAASSASFYLHGCLLIGNALDASGMTRGVLTTSGVPGSTAAIVNNAFSGFDRVAVCNGVDFYVVATLNGQATPEGNIDFDPVAALAGWDASFAALDAMRAGAWDLRTGASAALSNGWVVDSAILDPAIFASGYADFDGIVRSATNGARWAMGAYER